MSSGIYALSTGPHPRTLPLLSLISGGGGARKRLKFLRRPPRLRPSRPLPDVARGRDFVEIRVAPFGTAPGRRRHFRGYFM